MSGFGAPRIVLVDDARTALFHARASVVASGTATVQALTIGNPFVVVYRVSALTFALARRMIRYPAEIPAERDADGNLPVAMVNLIAGRRIVPELLNRRFTAANLAAALRPLLDETPERREMIAALAEAREQAAARARRRPNPSRLQCCRGTSAPNRSCRAPKLRNKRLTFWVSTRDRLQAHASNLQHHARGFRLQFKVEPHPEDSRTHVSPNSNPAWNLPRIRIALIFRATGFRAFAAAFLTLCALALPCWMTANAAPVRPLLNITGTVINADLDPATGKLTATADVTFTALEDLTTASFELNNGLNVTSLTDNTGAALNSERLAANFTVRVTLPAPLAKGSTNTFHFAYSGTLTGSDTSPVDGIKLAAIADPISMLLYAGRWFPMTGLFTDRFTAEMHIRVPAEYTAVGSGTTTKKTLARRAQRVQLRLVEAGISRNHRRGQVSSADHRIGHQQHPRLCDGEAQGRRAGLRRAGRARVRIYDQRLRPAGVGPHQHRRAAGGRRQRRVGAGDGMYRGQPHRGPHGGLAAPAEQHAGASVVGIGGIARNAQRRVDHQRHEPLWRADVPGRFGRQERPCRRPSATFPPERWPTTPSR